MKKSFLRLAIAIGCTLLFADCANVLPPTGGDKDETPPVLISVSPADSQLNARVEKVELTFDEYVQLAENGKDIQISPLMTVPLTIKSKMKKVTVVIPDTLLVDNTTYKISFNKAIRDLHESNPFESYQYTFSTGSYFDSLSLSGKVINSETGQPDTAASVLLYDLKAGDSAILYKTPSYITKVGSDGAFQFTGLPERNFYIFALRETSENMIFDKEDEWVAFADAVAVPGGDSVSAIILRSFKEEIPVDSFEEEKPARKPPARGSNPDDPFTYTVAVDTSDLRKKTFDITKDLSISFAKPLSAVNPDRISLTYDDNGNSKTATITTVIDSVLHNILHINTSWQLNKVYTLKLLKGFATDSSGNDAMPSKNSFRTKSEENYSRMKIHLPTRFYGNAFLLEVSNENDTIYHRPVADTMVTLSFLEPGTYTFKVIADRNENGKWDPGNFKERQQPEYVYPFRSQVTLKAAWDNIFDFDEPVKKPSVTDTAVLDTSSKVGIIMSDSLIAPKLDTTGQQPVPADTSEKEK